MTYEDRLFISHLAVITFALVASAGLGHESLPSLASCFGLTAIMLAARNGWLCGVRCGTSFFPAALFSIILRLEEGYRAACKVTDFIRRANHLTGAPPPPLQASFIEDHMDEGSTAHCAQWNPHPFVSHVDSPRSVS